MNNCEEQRIIGSKEIYLLSPDLNNIKSNSYFTNTLVNIVIEYLVKQVKIRKNIRFVYMQYVKMKKNLLIDGLIL